MKDIMFEQWKRELREAALSFDVEQYKAFYRKWAALGVYGEDLPQDNIIEIAIRKMVVNMTDAPEDKRKEAKEWLASRGFTEDM